VVTRSENSSVPVAKERVNLWAQEIWACSMLFRHSPLSSHSILMSCSLIRYLSKQNENFEVLRHGRSTFTNAASVSELYYRVYRALGAPAKIG
jgi:hypothetical protein